MKTVKKMGVRLHIFNKYSDTQKNYYSKFKKFELIIKKTQNAK